MTHTDVNTCNFIRPVVKHWINMGYTHWFTIDCHLSKFAINPPIENNAQELKLVDIGSLGDSDLVNHYGLH